MVNNEPKDALTILEKKIYRMISYGALILTLICIYFASKLPTENEKLLVNIVGFALFGMYGIFGLAVKNDVRVLDLRRFTK
ncbi:hypothetical protein [Glaciimonas sp. PAMC28666]|uniref:hypothetical protein n=1 Tax=Glaciimonas sp. PAMC28666 TaxID=2807626 RepID=UPI0019655938|nr:hypothetical protein [Glaciimonas sp. PAMC28666]QRX80834.1 hypothetical protein JQN73_11380 [Glaciimonas sp. PAMC28666]